MQSSVSYALIAMVLSRAKTIPGSPIQIGHLKNDGPFFKPAILGHEVVPSSHPGRPYHDFSADAVERMGLILLGISGEAAVNASTGRERLRPGSVFMAGLPCQAEILLQKGGAPWEFVYVLVRDAWPMRAFDWLRQQHGCVVHLNYDLPAPATLVTASKKLVAKARSTSERDLNEISCDTYLWFMLLVQAIEEGQDANARTRNGLQIQPSDIPAGCHTIKEFARQLHYSPSHLSRKLARTWQKAPGRTLRHARLEEAANLLRNTDLSVGEIAARVGYLSPSSFIRAFRLFFEQTPADWRHQPTKSMPIAGYESSSKRSSETGNPVGSERPADQRQITTISKRKSARRRD